MGPHAGREPDAKAELFNIVADPHETKDLSKSHAKLVGELTKKIDAWWNVDEG